MSPTAYSSLRVNQTLLTGDGINLYVSGEKVLKRINAGNIYAVDSIYGNDAGNSASGRLDFPYKTISGSLNNIVSGDTVIIYPGNYTEKNCWRNGVNYQSYPGAIVQNSTSISGIFDDQSNPPSVSTIKGGEYIFSTTDVLNERGTIQMVNSGSRLTIDCDAIRNQSPLQYNGAAVLQRSGFIDVTAKEITSLNSQGTVTWYNGEMRIKAGLLSNESAANACIYYVPTDGVLQGGRVWVDALEIRAVGTTILVFKSNLGQANAQLWVNALEIRATSTAQLEAANVINDAKVYINAQKISTAEPVQYLFDISSTAKVWITAMKLGGMPLTQSGGTCHLTTQDWLDDTGSVNYFIDVSGGTLIIHGGYFKSVTSLGLRISGGTVRLINCTIDTSAVATANPITKTGGTLILDNCIFVAANGKESIYATTAQTVKIQNSCSANTNINSNITLSPNAGFTVDSNII